MNNKPPTIHIRKKFVFFKNTFLKASLITLWRIKRVTILLVRAAKGFFYTKIKVYFNSSRAPSQKIRPGKGIFLSYRIEDIHYNACHSG